jgi:hypothetical protein
MRIGKPLLTLALAGILSACGGGGSTGAAATTADGVTKAAYNNDMATMSANFDSTLQTKVTRAEVGALSDQMHKLGDYQGLSLMATDLTKNEYTFRANFSKGTMTVVERLDPNGQVAAYRVFPTAST